jgi:hypothetical protein
MWGSSGDEAGRGGAAGPDDDQEGEHLPTYDEILHTDSWRGPGSGSAPT